MSIHTHHFGKTGKKGNIYKISFFLSLSFRVSIFFADPTQSELRGTSSLWTKLSLCFGGPITLFHCSVPRGRFTSYDHTRESLKGVCLSTLLSPRLSFLLSLSSQSFLDFVFYIMSGLSYLPRTRTSDPRRSPAVTIILFCLVMVTVW